jgi:hypothetical protein
VLSHHEVVRDTTETGLARLVGAMAVVLPSAGLLQTLASLGDYRQPAVAVVVWAALLASAAWLLPRARLEGLARRETTAAILIAVAAVAVIGWEHRPPRASGSIDLAVLGTVWLLALITLSQPPWLWISAALGVFGLHGALILWSQGTGAPSLAQLEASGYILATILTAFAALRPTLAMHARISARRAALASRLAAEHAAAAAVLADRRSRLARLELEALPLLRDVAEGRLDPADAVVRDQCARHAAALRHSMAGRAPEASAVAALLGPALRAARARGMLVDVQVIGDPGGPPADVARAVLAAVDGALGALPPHQVTLTVIAPGAAVELYLTYREPVPDTIEISWRDQLTGEAGWPALSTSRRWTTIPSSWTACPAGSARARRTSGWPARRRPWPRCWPGPGATPTSSCSTSSSATGPRSSRTWPPSARRVRRCWSCRPPTSRSRSGRRCGRARSATC